MSSEPSFPGPQAAQSRSTTTRSDLLLVAAVVLLGLSIRPGPESVWSALAGTTALMLSIHTGRRDNAERSSSIEPSRLFIGVVIFGTLGVIGWSPSLLGPSTVLLERLPGVVWITLAGVLYLFRTRLTRVVLSGVVVTTLVVGALFGTAHIGTIGAQGLDVWVLHVRTADALANGENPYTDAVTVSDGSPLANPDAVIEGYVYPPVTGIAYALGHWLSPDARYTSLVSWLVVVASVGILAVRRLSLRHALTMLLLASVPGWWFILRGAWTEPLSVMLMAIALALWTRPLGSGFGLGAALASKQYFFVTAPSLLLHRDTTWVHRLITATVVVVITVGAALIWDFSAFWNAAIAFHTSTPPRPDSANMVGLLAMFGFSWAPPAILPMALGFGASLWAGIASRSRTSLVMAMAFALAASFLVSSQAFANYWFVVFGLSGLALVTREEEAARSEPLP